MHASGKRGGAAASDGQTEAAVELMATGVSSSDAVVDLRTQRDMTAEFRTEVID